MDRQAHLEAFFRTPEEPPTTAMEFTEPPPVADQAPRVALNGTGQLAPEVLQKIKDATVYLRVKSSQGESEGSGFFGVERNAILTNAHVIGMLDRNAPQPESIRVVRNKGEKNETSFPAKVVAVDQDADLALLSVQQEGMPEPLLVKSALLQASPSTSPASRWARSRARASRSTSTNCPASRRRKGVLDKLQVHGDMLPGNSWTRAGRPRQVIGVCVSILRNTRINFAIPGDKVWRFLNGRLAELILDTPASTDGQLKVPVTVRMVDPLSRLRQALWNTGLASRPSRPAAVRRRCRNGRFASPDPLAGARATGRTRRAGPAAAAGRPGLWVQPSLVNSSGTRVWLSAQVYRARKRSRTNRRLVMKPAAEWPWSSSDGPRSILRPDGSRSSHSPQPGNAVHRPGPRPSGADLGRVSRVHGLQGGVALDGEGAHDHAPPAPRPSHSLPRLQPDRGRPGHDQTR
jgi:hypothetical protein